MTNAFFFVFGWALSANGGPSTFAVGTIEFALVGRLGGLLRRGGADAGGGGGVITGVRVSVAFGLGVYIVSMWCFGL